MDTPVLAFYLPRVPWTLTTTRVGIQEDDKLCQASRLFHPRLCAGSKVGLHQPKDKLGRFFAASILRIMDVEERNASDMPYKPDRFAN